MPEIVRVVMLHAAAYTVPILDTEGKQVMKEIEIYGGTTKVPATRNVYLHEGEVEVPKDIVDTLIANGSARYPTVTTIVTPEKQAGLEAPPSTKSKTGARTVADVDPSMA